MSITEPMATVAEAAELLRRRPQTIYRLIREGRFPAHVVKVGGCWLIDRAGLYAHLGMVASAGDHPTAETTADQLTEAP